jgi:HAMP domain-containing protein
MPRRQIKERDALGNPSHSGPAPQFCAWVDEVQMPQLTQHPHYQRQFRDRISELKMKQTNLARDIKGGRPDLEPAAGQVRREIAWLEGLLP